MGKGGEQSIGKTTASKQKVQYKLEHMPTEELRKWAKAYGVNNEKDRQYMLAELVRGSST